MKGALQIQKNLEYLRARSFITIQNWTPAIDQFFLWYFKIGFTGTSLAFARTCYHCCCLFPFITVVIDMGSIHLSLSSTWALTVFPQSVCRKPDPPCSSVARLGWMGDVLVMTGMDGFLQMIKMLVLQVWLVAVPISHHGISIVTRHLLHSVPLCWDVWVSGIAVTDCPLCDILCSSNMKWTKSSFKGFPFSPLDKLLKVIYSYSHVAQQKD